MKQELTADHKDWSPPPQPGALTTAKAVGVITSTFFFITLSVRMVHSFALGVPIESAIFVFILGYIMADFISGITHWFCDTFFEEDTPFIGKLVIYPFREHHIHPRRIVLSSFIEQDTANFFLMIPPLAACVWIDAPNQGYVESLISCSLLGLCFGLFCTNLFHKWAHLQNPPLLITLLQKSNLILNPQRHALHHRDHRRGFCVTSGWLNPILDSINFFSRLERVIRYILK